MEASNELEKINTQNDEKENEPKEKPKKIINFISMTVINKRLSKEKLKAEKENEISKGRNNSIIFNLISFLANFS